MSDVERPNQVAKVSQKQRQRDARAQHEADVRAVLATPEGRRVWWRLLERTGTWSRAYTERDNGRRDVGVELLEEAQLISPTEYVRMVAEQLVEVKRAAVTGPQKSEADTPA